MLTVKEVAEKLYVVPETVRNYIRVGVGSEKTKLNAIQVLHGRRKEYRIKLQDLEEFKQKALRL